WPRESRLQSSICAEYDRVARCFSIPLRLRQKRTKEFARINAMGRVVRARVNAAWFRMLRAEIARSGFLFHDGAGAPRRIRIGDLHGKRVHVDIAVGTILRAQTATDAPVFNNHFQRIAAPNRTHRTAHHAQRVAALAAGGGYKVFIETQAFANQARDAVVRIGASADASIAARATLEIENQQALRLHQALREKILQRCGFDQREAFAILALALERDGFEAAANLRKLLEHQPKLLRRNAHNFDMVKRGA